MSTQQELEFQSTTLKDCCDTPPENTKVAIKCFDVSLPKVGLLQSLFLLWSLFVVEALLRMALTNSLFKLGILIVVRCPCVVAI